MTKILNFALKIKGLVGRVAHAKSSNPATPQNLEHAPNPKLQKMVDLINKIVHCKKRATRSISHKANNQNTIVAK